LAELVDLAERPRIEGWSLRAALCRYAQPQPERAGAVLSVLRRVEAALGTHLAELRTDGAGLLARAETSTPSDADADADAGADAELIGLLVVAGELDALGAIVAAWAVDRAGERPDDAIDEVTARASARLAELGVAEEAPIPRGMRGRG
jgi:hypothetical protein